MGLLQDALLAAPALPEDADGALTHSEVSQLPGQALRQLGPVSATFGALSGLVDQRLHEVDSEKAPLITVPGSVYARLVC
ncbi:hypothetical protein ACIRRH_37965 [Kitasatospora sp. NPDC101235]|uniref:hypothetical protein n=1 Tax=Kitasatospora sp. NPDC101235 TaxID=3364101 RepID=UPI00381C8485